MLEIEHALLRERFQMLLSQEQQALDAYADLVSRVTDPALREQVEQLHRDKQRHIELTERLLEIVS
jgi:rubrerythrin